MEEGIKSSSNWRVFVANHAGHSRNASRFGSVFWSPERERTWEWGLILQRKSVHSVCCMWLFYWPHYSSGCWLIESIASTCPPLFGKFLMAIVECTGIQDWWNVLHRFSACIQQLNEFIWCQWNGCVEIAFTLSCNLFSSVPAYHEYVVCTAIFLRKDMWFHPAYSFSPFFDLLISLLLPM